MSFDPTPEQIAIFAEADSPESLMVEALAGSGKTTTIVQLTHRMKVQPTLAIAFNKKNAQDLAERMPSFVECKTFNALGHRVWQSTIGKRLTLNTDKPFLILTEVINGLSKREADDANEIKSSLLRGIRMAKSLGYIPAKSGPFSSLISREELAEALVPHLDCNTDKFYLNILDEVLLRSIKASFDGLIDFDDQIYMSTLFGGSYPRYPLVIVDEAQDLSLLNHATLRLLVRDRLIAVGDPNQSIYGFRGAHANSMTVLRDSFAMKTLPLSTSFRCSRAVIRQAQLRVPQMSWPESAPEGSVTTYDHWTQHDIPDGAVIICRNNAPLFSLAMKLIREGRGIKLAASDIGAGLIRLLDKISRRNCERAELLELIRLWEQSELERAHKSRHAAIRDRAECLRVFATFGKDKDEAKAYAQHLFSQSGPISLMTGHKSKGLEFDNVFFLDSYLIPSKFARRLADEGDHSFLEQELNLSYVITTRAKQNLYFVNSEEYASA